MITCTGDHPFWVVGRGWVKARDLTSQDCLLDIHGGVRPISAVTHERLQKPVRVYNITVDNTHTYYVGNVGVLVHNKPR